MLQWHLAWFLMDYDCTRQAEAPKGYCTTSGIVFGTGNLIWPALSHSSVNKALDVIIKAMMSVVVFFPPHVIFYIPKGSDGLDQNSNNAQRHWWRPHDTERRLHIAQTALVFQMKLPSLIRCDSCVSCFLGCIHSTKDIFNLGESWLEDTSYNVHLHTIKPVSFKQQP